MVMKIIVDGLVSGADTEKLERHIFRMYDSNKVGGTLCLGVVFFEILWEIFRSEIPIPMLFLMLDSNKAGGTL